MGELVSGHHGAIRWRDVGTGEPIVVLPGLSLPVWPVFEPLTCDARLVNRRFILIDYLGSGASDHPKDFDYSLSSHAGTIVDVLQHLGIRGADVFGYSMGGSVAIQLALEHPDCVGRLVIAEGNLAPGGGEASRRIAAEARDGFIAKGYARLLGELRDAGLTAISDGWEVADPAGIWGNAHALVHLAPGFFGRFLSLDLPRCFIFGETSLARVPTPDVPDPEVLRTAGVSVAVVPGAGHLMMWDNPDGFTAAVASAFSHGSASGA